MKRTLLFRRDFQGYTGGHGKVRDYFGHAAAHPAWDALVHLVPGSSTAGNPWADVADPCPSWDPARADALFLAGMDWQAYPADDAMRPVINLVQHVRHADPALPLSGFLHRPAIRICVSQPVADAILATGRVNGPVRVIDAAINLPSSIRGDARRAGTFIDAIKQPGLGRALAQRLHRDGQDVSVLAGRVPREAYLRRLAEASVAVLLPHPTEGFYLPALEAMALGCAVVVPDCVGNRAYLSPGENALAPPLELEALARSALQLEDPSLRSRLAANGRATAARFDLPTERARFHAVLDALPALWPA